MSNEEQVAPRTMRAKMKISAVTLGETCDQVTMAPVCKSGAYPADGMDEDNSFAKFSPSGELKLTIANPALLGKFRPGQKFYLDFTEAIDPPPKPIRADLDAVPNQPGRTFA
jgi:hypothetical protein